MIATGDSDIFGDLESDGSLLLLEVGDLVLELLDFIRVVLLNKHVSVGLAASFGNRTRLRWDFRKRVEVENPRFWQRLVENRVLDVLDRLALFVRNNLVNGQKVLVVLLVESLSLGDLGLEASVSESISILHLELLLALLGKDFTGSHACLKLVLVQDHLVNLVFDSQIVLGQLVSVVVAELLSFLDLSVEVLLSELLSLLHLFLGLLLESESFIGGHAFLKLVLVESWDLLNLLGFRGVSENAVIRLKSSHLLSLLDSLLNDHVSLDLSSSELVLKESLLLGFLLVGLELSSVDVLQDLRVSLHELDADLSLLLFEEVHLGVLGWRWRCRGLSLLSLFLGNVDFDSTHDMGLLKLLLLLLLGIEVGNLKFLLEHLLSQLHELKSLGKLLNLDLGNSLVVALYLGKFF